MNITYSPGWIKDVLSLEDQIVERLALTTYESDAVSAFFSTPLVDGFRGHIKNSVSGMAGWKNVVVTTWKPGRSMRDHDLYISLSPAGDEIQVFPMTTISSEELARKSEVINAF